MSLFGLLYILLSYFTAEQTATRQNASLPNNHVGVGLEGGVFGIMFANYIDA